MNSGLKHLYIYNRSIRITYNPSIKDAEKSIVRVEAVVIRLSLSGIDYYPIHKSNLNQELKQHMIEAIEKVNNEKPA